MSAILFVVFFDFKNHPIGIFFVYADDGSLLIFGKTWTEVNDFVLRALEMVDSWCLNNEMTLSLHKCWFLPLGGHQNTPKPLENLPVKKKTISYGTRGM